MFNSKAIRLTLIFLITSGCISGQGKMIEIPQILKKNGRYTLLVDGKPYFVLGGQAHNSSAWPAMLPQLWKSVRTLHANTLEVPVYWEQIEKVQGKFDFSSIDILLRQSRQNHMRLILLWFGTWKNGSNHYTPGWIKRDAVNYPNITGRNGSPVDSPSPHVTSTLGADIRAFTAVMKFLKKNDRERTVIMVQVENEPGSWGSVRDYGHTAQQIFEQAVPDALLTAEIFRSLQIGPVRQGTWQEVFGDRADECFQAWHIAGYINKVAAAGKAIYPLPVYVNVALRDPFTNPDPRTYESGGATDNMIAVWKAAAPAVDLLGPDIYLAGVEKVMKIMELYDRSDNPLFVPEIALIPENAKYLYEVIARGGIGFSPFGIDANSLTETASATMERLASFAQEYVALAPMIDKLAMWGRAGKIKAVIAREDNATQTLDLGAWKAVITFHQEGDQSSKDKARLIGKMMVVTLSNNKFLLIGSSCHITFRPAGDRLQNSWQYLSVEEGGLKNGAFKAFRVLNGDETDFGGPRLGQKPEILQVSLIIR